MDCTPAVYEHAAYLIGRSPWEVSRNADLTYQLPDNENRKIAFNPKTGNPQDVKYQDSKNRIPPQTHY